MKRVALVLFLAVVALTSRGRADVELNFEFFHSSLEPYGEWVSAGDYGYAWHPRDVGEEWAPYTDGYWAYTDAGWTWVSYEDWGGITYHYGRWVRVGGVGWCWVPEYEWGPAWVSWRRSDTYIGWAPLPPEARWHRNTGFGIWVDTEFDIGPGWFRFCRVHEFCAPVLFHVLLPCARNVTFIEQTTNITNITYRSDRGHAFNCGPDFNWVSARVTHPITALTLVHDRTNVFVHGNRGNVFVNAQRGNTLVMGMPAVAPGATTAQPVLAVAPRSIPAPQVDRGWDGLAHDPARDRIAAKFKQDAQGLTSKTAQASAFDPASVAAIPQAKTPPNNPARNIPPHEARPQPLAEPRTGVPKTDPLTAAKPERSIRAEKSIPPETSSLQPPQRSLEAPHRESVAPRLTAPEVFRRPVDVEIPRSVEHAPMTRPSSATAPERSKTDSKGRDDNKAVPRR